MRRLIVAALVGSLCVVGAIAHAAPRSYSPELRVDVGDTSRASTTDGSQYPYEVFGCGYNKDFGGVTIVVHSPEATSFAGQLPQGENGCIDIRNFSTQGHGHYQLDAYQTVHRKSQIVASTSFDL